MRTRTMVVVAMALALAATCLGCSGMTSPSAATAESEAISSVAPVSPAVSAEGVVVPVQRAVLSFSIGGLLRQVSTREGEEVAEGTLLASLDAGELELAVREAEDALAVSQSMLDKARVGAREPEVAAARAEYDRALAQHEQLLRGARGEEIAAAEANVQAAMASYERVASGASDGELIAGRASMERAEVTLKHAQAEYDKYAWQQGFEASPQADALHQATIDFRAAEAQLEQLEALPRQADLQEAGANLARARAQLALQQAGATEQEVAASASSVAVARAQLELREAGPRAEDIAVAEAQVQQALTALERAKLALSRSQLLAPFDGTIVEVAAERGEMVLAGSAAVALADLTELQVETTDLDEWAAVDVHEGQAVRITVNAFEDKGDTAYTVTIALSQQDPELRWGMTTKVEFLEE
jgi:multidrug efflux pump subunit AcrA (membrane-fusion protein)